ncbi:SIMPL domain-containing protein [Marinimicrococcus flavescens]|uniref:SIMPL domain-containing protein n=1 Tax=Marinimicrococcus flavescens TaxID=3031815 RepID=A0AAP4D620_9PROT|nr:SIMPL domain-containing protein [Marinimicrococcus flavescens]
MRITGTATALVMLCLAAGTLPAMPAAAQQATASQDGVTMLQLSESARREVTPDLLTVVLGHRAEASEVAKAQEEVNTRIARVRDAVAGKEAIRLATGGYNTWMERREDESSRWVAQQTIRLESKDSGLLLETVGSLQQEGLAVEGMHWSLTAERRRELERELIDEALEALRSTAGKAAASMGMSVQGWSGIALGQSGGGHFPPPMPRMAAMKAEAAPVAEPGTTVVEVSVSGEARLR